jgi:hypothetical protein
VLGLTADWEVGRTLPPRFLYKIVSERNFLFSLLRWSVELVALRDVFRGRVAGVKFLAATTRH